MKYLKAVSVLLIIVLIFFIVAVQGGFFAKEKVSATADKTKYTATFLDVFDTRTDILGYGSTEDEFSEQAELIKERLIFYNKLYDIYNNYEGINNIKTINDNAGVAPVEVEPEISDDIDFT